MSSFWIDDLDGFSEVFKELNKRLDIKNDDIDGSVRLTAEQRGKDLYLIVTATEFANDDGGAVRMEFSMEYNMDFQSVDEVVYSLKKMMGLPL